MTDWDDRFLSLAEHVAGWSKDPSTKVGAVIANSDRVVHGIGYNGFPRGVGDDQERYDDRPTKYGMVVHAELNAILNAAGAVRGSTLYVWPLPPCNECAKAIIQAGIKRVVFRSTEATEGRWREQYAVSALMFREAGVEVMELVE